MRSEDVYLPENDKYLEQIEEEYDWYCWIGKLKYQLCTQRNMMSEAWLNI